MNFIVDAPILAIVLLLLGALASRWRYGKIVDTLKEHVALKDAQLHELKSKTGGVLKKRMSVDIKHSLELIKKLIVKYEQRIINEHKMFEDGLAKSMIEENADMHSTNEFSREKYKDEALKHFDFLNELLGNERDEKERQAIYNPETLSDIKTIHTRIKDLSFAIDRIEF